MKHCIKCGKELPDNAVFCDGCGTNIRRHRPANDQLPGLPTIMKWTYIMMVACIVAALIVGVMYIFMGKPAQKNQSTSQAPTVENALPFGLEFGMSYDAFAAQVETVGHRASPLKNADENVGYVVNPIHEAGAIADEQMGITMECQDQQTTDSRDTAYYFGFNQDKQLCSFRWVNDTKTEVIAETLLQALAKDYIPRFGISRYQEGESSFTWEDKNFKVTIAYDAEDSTMTLTVHDYTCD